MLGPFLYTVSTKHYMTVSLPPDGESLGTVWAASSPPRCCATPVCLNPRQRFNDYVIARKA